MLSRVLLSQLAPTGKTLRVEPAFADGRLDGAAWLMGVGAVAELAERGKFGDFSEQRVDTKVLRR